jgi:membrane-associated phospholipid phosphatase
MLDQILQWDQTLFFAINHSHFTWFDAFMPYYRHKVFWVPLYVFIIAFFIWNFPKNGLWIVFFALLTVGLSDTVSSQWIKKTVKRLRPCNDLEIQDQVTLRIRCGGGYSFTSSHATNHAAVAFFIFFLFKNHRRFWRWMVVFWAVTVGVAQIYVGVHYPLDVLTGLLIGTVIGWLLAGLFHRWLRLE